MRFKTDKVVNTTEVKRDVSHQSLFSSQTSPVFCNPQSSRWPAFQIPLKKQWHRRQAFIDNFSTTTSSNVNPFLAALENTKNCLSNASSEKKPQSNETADDANTFVVHPFSSGQINLFHPKPKGLVDGLSKFFTPSNKRKSRVAISSLGHAIEDEIQANQAANSSLSGSLFCDQTSISKNHFNSPINFCFKSQCQEACGSFQSSAINNDPSNTPAITVSLASTASLVPSPSSQEGKSSGSLKNLFDGLSHLYTTPSESRKRQLKGSEPPNYSARKRRVKGNEPKHLSCKRLRNNISSKCVKTIESKRCDRSVTGDKKIKYSETTKLLKEDKFEHLTDTSHEAKIDYSLKEKARIETSKKVAVKLLSSKEKSNTEPLSKEKAKAEPSLKEKGKVEPLSKENTKVEPLLKEKTKYELLLKEKAKIEPLLRERDKVDFITKEKASFEHPVKEKANADFPSKEKVRFEHPLKEKAKVEPLSKERAAAEPPTKTKSLIEFEFPSKDLRYAFSFGNSVDVQNLNNKIETFSVCHLNFDKKNYHLQFYPSSNAETLHELAAANKDLSEINSSCQSSKTDEKDEASFIDTLTPVVTEEDIELFEKAQAVADKVNGVSKEPLLANQKPSLIQFGKYAINILYSSPYPKDFLRLPKLFLCEFCLKYMKSKKTLTRHMGKCTLTRPPAEEIYRKQDLSVFEVDGMTNKTYCQNLCLLTKLFLDHKTLFYDVESFLFYILTTNDKKGCHLVGYFSKERHCQQKYNVSCIMVLPQHRRKGYGHFLISLSYHLSRKAGKYGTPEKPLSNEGRACYTCYWKSVILEHFHSCDSKKKITLKSICKATGMTMIDVISTLGALNMLKRGESGKLSVLMDESAVKEHIFQTSERKMNKVVFDSNCLIWEPQPLIKAECKKCKRENSRFGDSRKQYYTENFKSNNKFEKMYIGGTWYSKEKIKCETCLITQERERRKLKCKNKRRHFQRQGEPNSPTEPKKKRMKFTKLRNSLIDSSDESDDYVKYTSAKIRSLKKKLMRKHKFRQMKFQERRQKLGVLKYSVTGESKTKMKVHGFIKESTKLNIESKKKLRHKRLKKGKYKKLKKKGRSDSSVTELTKDKKKHKVKMKKAESSKSSSGEKESVPTPPVLQPAIGSDEDMSHEENSGVSDHNLSPPLLHALSGNSSISVVKSSDSSSSDESSESSSNKNASFELQHNDNPIPELLNKTGEMLESNEIVILEESCNQENISEKLDSEKGTIYPVESTSDVCETPAESMENMSDIVSVHDSFETDNPETNEFITQEAVDVPPTDTEIATEKPADVCESNAILEATELIVKQQLMELPSVEEICIDDPICIPVEEERNDANENSFKDKSDESYNDDDGEVMMIHHTMPVSGPSTVDMTCVSSHDEFKNEEEENEVREAVETINVQMEHPSTIDLPLTPLTPQSPDSNHSRNVHHHVNSYSTEYDNSVIQAADDSNHIDSQEVECLSNEMSENLHECRYPQKQYSAEVQQESNSSSGPYSQEIMSQPEIIIDAAQISQPVSQVSQLSSPSTPGGTMVSKNTPTPQEMSSMGVYTPDSSTNSGYNSVEIDVCQLGLESPTSVCSSEMAQNSVEPPHSTPTPQPYPDCAQLNSMSPYCTNTAMSDMCSSNSRREMIAATAAAQAAVAQAQAQAHHTPNSNSGGNSVNVSSRKRQNNSQRITNLPPAGPVSSIMQSSMVSVNATAVNALFVGPAPNGNNAYAMNMSVPCSNAANPGGPVAGSYMVGVPLATVIQPQSTAAFAAASMQNHHQASQNFSMANHPSAAISGAMQRLTHVGVSPSMAPSSCSVTPVTSNFHIQSPSYTYTPTPTPTPNTPSQIGTSCSLAKLQQLTNGIMDIVPNPACNTMTPPPNMTPPSPQVNMTPPPQMQRSLASLQPQIPMQPSSHGYSKYHFHHRQVQRNPNVALSPNLVASYQTINGVGYRIQQAPSAAMLNTGYITNAGFINQAQLPPSAAVQMGMVNVNMHGQTPYQDTLQTARPQNAMYTTYSYHISGNLPPQPLNQVMRR